MRVIISNDQPTAMFYIRRGLARAFSAIGAEVVIWDITKKSPFDMFDEFEPTIFFGETYNLTPGLIKCIQERPHLRVILRASDRSEFTTDIFNDGYPILIANDKEVGLVNELRDKTGKPDILHNHYTQRSIEKTHSGWINDGYNVKGLLSAGDIFEFYKGEYREEWSSDICFCGGRWGYKAKNIDKYFLPIVSKYKTKIFGNQGWGIPQFCGFAPDDQVKHLLKSAKVCPNISEPHSTLYGYDIVERPYKLLLNRCLCISDYVKDMEVVLPHVVMAKTPQEFAEKIDYFIHNKEKRDEIIELGFEHVYNNHTYLDRVQEILGWLNLPCPDINEIKAKI